MKRKNKKHSRLSRAWRRYEYKHSTLAIAAIVGFILALDTALIQALLASINTLGLFGIFIAGILFVSFFTAAPAVVLLLNASNDFNPLTIALVAGLGSVIGDWVILKLFDEKVAYELVPLARKFGLMPIIRLFKRKIFRPVALTLGALCIATPLPDEIGIALLGLSHLRIYKLLAIAFVLNVIGVYVIVQAARVASL